MTATFDYKKCINCGICYNVCPMDIIMLDKEGKPHVIYPDECQLCFICQEECPTDAIKVKIPIAFW